MMRLQLHNTLFSNAITAVMVFAIDLLLRREGPLSALESAILAFGVAALVFGGWSRYTTGRWFWPMDWGRSRPR